MESSTPQTLFRETSGFRYFVTVILLLLLGCRSTLCQDCRWKTYEEPGDVNLAVLLSLRAPKEDKSCGEVVYGSLQLLTAVQYVIRKLNSPGLKSKQSFIPGVKIGFTVNDDCGNARLASARALNAIHREFPSSAIDCGSHTTPRLAGFIGPSRSQSALAISSLLDDTGIPLIGVATTLTDLSNKTRYPNVMRTAVSDKEQTKAIVSLVKRQDWSAIAILHTDDEYSRDLAKAVQRLAEESSVCVLHMTHVSSVRDVRMTVKTLLDIQAKTARNSLGVVHLGQRESARKLSYILLDEYRENPDAVRKLQWIFPDSVGTDASLFNNTLGAPSSQEYLQNVWSISPSSLQLDEFGDFFRSQTRAVIEGEVNATNPWLKDFVQKSCRPPHDSNAGGCREFKQGDYVTAGIHAVYALSLAMKRMHKKLCAGATGLCEAFKMKSSLDFLCEVRGIRLRYTDFDVHHTVPEMAQENVTVHFDASGDVKLSLDQQIYDINRYDQGTFTKVGFYRQNGILHLRASHNLPSVCRTPCPECESRSPFVYLPGEVLLAGFFSLRWAPEQDDPFGCGPFRSSSHAIMSVEGFLYAVKKYREQTGIKFGAVIFDDCYSSVQAVTIVTQFFSGRAPLVDPATGHVIDLSQVVAVIGSESSGVSLPLAEYFKHLRMPLISPSSSSPDLDDKGLYPYLLRTCASDSISSDVFVAILKHFGWTYVSFVYINNNYGHKAMMYTRQKAHREGICVAEPLPIELNPSEKDMFGIVKKLNSNGAKVVLYIGVDQNAKAFENIIKYYKIDLVFLSLGDCLSFQPNIGSLAILQNHAYLPWTDFEDYLRNRQPSLTKSSVWFDTFWQQIFQCNLPGRSENPEFERCDDHLKFSNKNVQKWGNQFKVTNTINAVVSAMSGSVKASQFLCREESVFKCKAFQENPAHVTEFIKNVSLGYGVRSYRPYLANGNGNLDFKIWSLQEQPDGSPKYNVVGTYSPEHKKLLMISQNTPKFFHKGKMVDNVTSSCTPGGACPSCGVLVDLDTPGIELTFGHAEKHVLATLVIVCVMAAVLVLALVFVPVFVVRRSRRERKPNQHLAPRILSAPGREGELRFENPPSESSSDVSHISGSLAMTCRSEDVYPSTIGSLYRLYRMPSLRGVRNVRHFGRLPRAAVATDNGDVTAHDNRSGNVVNPHLQTDRAPRVFQNGHITRGAKNNSDKKTTTGAPPNSSDAASPWPMSDPCRTSLKTVVEEDDIEVQNLDEQQTNTMSMKNLITSPDCGDEQTVLGTSRKTPVFGTVNSKRHSGPQLPETFV